MIEYWTRNRYDGIWEFVGYASDGNDNIHTKLDIDDGRAMELWERIKEEFPHADNRNDFFRAYREGKEEFDAYAARDQRRYDNYWR
jgi:hypothetical protein